jgi:uncharacterized membrane protein YfcA
VIIACLGALGAFISGLLGVGGGIIYIPVVEYYLKKMGMEESLLVKGILANSLFTILFSGSVSSYNQYKHGNFHPKQILHTAWPGILSALIVTLLIKNGTWYNKSSFNVVFASMLFVIVWRMFSRKSNVEYSKQESPNWQYQLTGFFAGIVTAFSGLGGGVIMTPAFTDLMKISIKKASSISNGVIPLFALVLGIYNLSDIPTQYVSEWQIGYVVLPVVAPLIISTFIFAPMGVRFAQKTSHNVIRFTFASFAGIVFIKLLYEILTKK